MEQLRTLQQALLATNEELDSCAQKLTAGNGYSIQQLEERTAVLTTQQFQLIEELQAALQRLESLGCTLKDVDRGLVDFYALRDGDIVCLCWRADEEQIRFWHGVEDGFAGRKPI